MASLQWEGCPGSATRHHHNSPGWDAWWKGQRGPIKGTLCRGLPSFSIFQISCKSRFSGMGLLFQVLRRRFKSKLTLFSESAFPASRQRDVSQTQTDGSASVGLLQSGTLTGCIGVNLKRRRPALQREWSAQFRGMRQRKSLRANFVVGAFRRNSQSFAVIEKELLCRR